MINSSLIELLKSYNPKEIKEFGEYINSPFFNKNQGVIKLYDYIRKHFTDLNKFDKQFVFSKLFPHADYNDGFMRTMMFSLNKLAEDYVKYCEFSNDRFTREKYLLEAFEKRSLKKHFEKKFREVKKETEQDELKKTDYYYNNYILEQILNTYNVTHGGGYLNEKDTRADELENESEFLISFFIHALINRHRKVINESFAFKHEARMTLYPEMTEFIRKNPSYSSELIQFYVNLISLMKADKLNKEYYYSAKKFLLNNFMHFRRAEVYTLFINMLNIMGYFADKITMHECFSLWNIMLDNNLYYPTENAVFDSSDFGNVVIIATRLNEFDWLKKFIDKYKNKIEPGERENAANYAYAHYYYHVREYEKSVKFLARVQPTSLHYKMRIKTLSFQLYYDMGWYEEAMNQIDSFRHFIASNPLLTKYYVERNENFIRIARKLIKIKNGFSKIDLTSLKIELEKAEPISSKGWFMTKIEEIEKAGT